MAASGNQPPTCSCARHSSGMIAERWRPSGYLAISFFAQARFCLLKEKSFGCISGGARRRTDMTGSPDRFAVLGGDLLRIRRFCNEAGDQNVALAQEKARPDGRRSDAEDLIALLQQRG